MGHLTFIALEKREMLSVFRSTYDFIRAHYRHAVLVWPSVRAEIRAFRGLMIFIEAPLDMGWDSTVLCSGSCPTGFGVRAKHFEPSAVMSGVGMNVGDSSLREVVLSGPEREPLTLLVILPRSGPPPSRGVAARVGSQR